MNNNLTMALEEYKNKKIKYIYHYSDKLYQDIRSLRAQGNLSDIELDKLDKEYTRMFDKEPYTKNISFFIEPIPYKIIGDLFDNKHDSWHNGNELYEYKTDINSLEKDIVFKITETPTAVEFIDMHYNPTMSEKEYVEFMREKSIMLEKNGYEGEGLDNLIKTASKFLGTTKDYFIEARKRLDAKETSKQYAANVPHLMLYPESGIIKYQSYRKVVIGKDN